MNKEAQRLANELALQPHPEGGWYRETFRSDEEISPEGLPYLKGSRNLTTLIYFLLTGDSFSAFHTINSDEIWYFHQGSNLHIHQLGKEGYNLTKLGENNFHHVVPRGCSFAAQCSDPQGYSLVSCSVTPGFSFEDFRMDNKDVLIADFPDQKKIIQKLTRS